MKRKPIIPIILVILIICYVGWRWFQAVKPVDHIVLSGFVEGTEVTVRSQVSAQVLDIPIQEGQRIKKDDVIATINPEKTEFELKSSESDLAALDLDIIRAERAIQLYESGVERNIGKANAGAKIAEQQLKEMVDGYPEEDVIAAETAAKLAKDNLKYAEDDYNRYKKLYDKGVISKKDYENAEKAFNAAKKESEIRDENYSKLARGFEKEKVEQSRKNYEIAKISLQDATAARNEIEQKKRELEAQKNKRDSLKSKIDLTKSKLSDFTIRSPVDGIVTQKLIEAGELASPGTSIVNIIKPDEKWIRIYVPATQYGNIKLGDELSIQLDAFPDREFKGKVSFIAEDAEFTPKNIQIKEERVKQVYEVKLDIVQDAELVKTGMEGDVILKLNNGKN